MSKKIKSKQGVRYDRVGLELLWRKKNRNALLQLGADGKKRQGMAEDLQVDISEVEQVLSGFDLERIVGIGPKFASYCQLIKVPSIASLADSRGNDLHQLLSELRTQNRIIKRIPSFKQCHDFVEQANHLPILIKM